MSDDGRGTPAIPTGCHDQDIIEKAGKLDALR
jgi:hypothetical protein